MRIRQLQKPKTRSVRCGGSRGSARRGSSMPPTEGPWSFSSTPLPSTPSGELSSAARGGPQLAVQRASSHRQKCPSAQLHPVGARQLSLAQSQALQGRAGSPQNTPLGTLSCSVRTCPVLLTCLHPSRGQRVPIWEAPPPLSTPVSPGPRGNASCHAGTTEVHHPAHLHDSARDQRTDCSEYHVLPCARSRAGRLKGIISLSPPKNTVR